MDIAIDVSTLINHGSDIGAGRYIYNLVKNLFSIDSKNRYTLISRSYTDEHMGILEAILPDSAGEERVAKRYMRVSSKGLERWDRLGFPPLEFKGFKAGLLHCPDYVIPPTLNKNIVLTIHDLSFMRFPEFNFKWFIEKYKKMVKKNASLAKRIIADSISTKDDIVGFFGIGTEKIDVIPLASDPAFRKLDENEIDRGILDRYGTGKDFILSVGTIEPRKDFPTLIAAFERIKDKKNIDLKLAIAGRTGWKSEATYEAWEKSVYRDDIVFLGRVLDSDLALLYNLASVFAYPTIFEGFGLPVLEAMSCGCPVISTYTSSIPEIIDDDSCLVEVGDIKGLAEKIERVLEDKDLRNRMASYSIRRSCDFSWEKTARMTLDTYRKTLQAG